MACRKREVENSPIIEGDITKKVRKSIRGGERDRNCEKKAVIGGAWWLSNTEGLVMIPLALCTVRKKRQKNREKGRQRERMTEREKEKPKTRKRFTENTGR